jgi:hypothetical protein
MRHSCQLPSPICFTPSMGSMFLADAVGGFLDRRLSGHCHLPAGQIAIVGKWSKVTGSISWVTGRGSVVLSAYLWAFGSLPVVDRHDRPVLWQKEFCLKEPSDLSTATPSLIGAAKDSCLLDTAQKRWKVCLSPIDPFGNRGALQL